MKVKVDPELCTGCGLCVGEKTLEQVRRKIANVSKTKIEISGRCRKTGKKKAVSAKFDDLNW